MDLPVPLDGLRRSAIRVQGRWFAHEVAACAFHFGPQKKLLQIQWARERLEVAASRQADVLRCMPAVAVSAIAITMH